MLYIVDLYLVLFFYLEWRLSLGLLNALLERTRRMKKLTALLAFCWVLLVSQILAISSLYNDGLQDIPGPPSVVTLVEHQSSEMQIESKLEENIEATLKNISLHDLAEDGAVETPEDYPQTPLGDIPTDRDSTTSEASVQLAPEQPEHLGEKIDDSGGTDEPPKPDEAIDDNRNITGSESPLGSEVNLTEENPMPVFSEWAQKQMAEAEKKLGENVNASAMKRNSKPAGGKMPPLKLRAKNYAAPDCGAKIIASNAEAQSTGSVLTSHKDEYLLNPCTSKIWFVVELCEPIQAERVEMANFELFSSSPRDFSVAVSNRFPTRDWANVGQFTAKDERDVQSFNLHPHLFGKFVRVEIHSHYNSEHYCPVSLFRVYGTSEFEAFETDNAPSQGDDDDVELVTAEDGLHLGGEISIDSKQLDSGEMKPKKTENILKSAGEAVMNIVKKAAEALGKTNDGASLGNGTESNLTDETRAHIDVENSNDLLHSRSNSYCFSLAYQPRCVICPHELQLQLERTLSCNYYLLTSLLNVEQISSSFNESQHLLCANILGYFLSDSDSQSWAFNGSLLSWFPAVHLAGFCNIRALDNGLLEPVVRTEQKSPSDDENSLEQAGEESSSSEPSELPSSQTTAGSNEHAGNEGFRAVDSPPTEEEEVTKQSLPQEEVNIFTLPEESNSSESPPVDDQQLVTEKVPELSTSATEPTQQEKDHDATVLNSNGNPLEDIEGLLLDDHHLEGSDVASGATGVGGIPTIASTTSTTPSPDSLTASVPAATQKGQPESVFLRLSNRIKALERNMSLSGQYLEELSRRYRKQVEELHQSHAKTLSEIEEQNHRIRESEDALRQENERLRQEFSLFRDSLLNWRTLAVAVGTIAVTQLLVCWIVLRSCRRQMVTSPDRETIDRELAQLSTSGKLIRGKLLRRKSIDGVIGGAQLGVGSLKKKRPSEEALNISGTYENLLIEDNGRGDGVKSDRKRSRNKHRKTSVPAGFVQQVGSVRTKRANSAEPPEAKLAGKPDLVRTESAPEPRRLTPELSKPDEHNRIDELPLLEDNDEFIIPTASDLSYNEFIPDSTSELVSRTNGMGSSTSSIDSKPAGKPGIGRRLSSPAFFKSSFLRSSRRSSGKKITPSQNLSSASSNTSSSGSSSVRINMTNNHNSVAEDPSSVTDVSGLEPVITVNNNNSINKRHSSGNEWYKLKKSSSQNSNKFGKRKAKSESPEVQTVGNGSINGTDSEPKLKMSSSFNGSTSSSEKKLTGNGGGSFRRLLRKVF
ncbi:SUN domain-containing ossification factor isoform X2 [Wyeomyia smithii]|uniref:SUN domain-containing ossification factor isoform X2 n=1 Tax=Wyeomyia smithii TaxID=174621 RepID=UPI002467EEEE|nr:SUN domain-containing ossification factor isoform X2 [Wyeomyia smithii]XP_055540793.1 SUN domain-containing ossification factor isoform X2 [Wyeomyia smithii]XP_055540794.1 SUN domain-containing ossification factor isoform X2 [Wyeomyia smithii]XP_055540795.1 SUN domain-containing ossification factor isoform X2 [Wyeomyia smithii]XP_055540796.1 SUN domain-containing ossification factor isoform X2 [Wyeomyia smithii]XP_055540797.1 SUN domain-containing ossification factor isoform X2 [Wyeomyia sm